MARRSYMPLAIRAMVLIFSLAAAPPTVHSAAALDRPRTLLTPQQAVKYKGISDLRFAADGQSAVCTVSEVNGPQIESHIWIIDSRRVQLHQLTSSEKSERSPEWSPNDDSVGFLSNR